MNYLPLKFLQKTTLVFLFGLLTITINAQDNQRYNLIPYPASLTPASGSFIINKQTVLSTSSAKFTFEAGFLKKLISGYIGVGPISKSAAGKNIIILKYDAAVADSEGYKLVVAPQNITLSASSAAGMFLGIETLRQLMPADVEVAKAIGTQIAIPCVEIQDQPAFAYRGMMLDVARHFFSTDYLKKYIDMMAMYKFNKLHLHLTDDQGWRIEIKKYPKLTEVSAWRTYNNQDSACMQIAAKTGNTDFLIDKQHIKIVAGKQVYGGFYTQEQMKDVIKYAAARHIEIIPEIDMPGHMGAATKAYPFLTCKDGTSGNNPNDFSAPICPCNDETIKFAEDVYAELAALFPSSYMHIGGDEVDRSHWAQAQACKDFMAKNNIHGLEKLQSFFTKHMEKFFMSKGKKLIGWDEVLEGGIDSTTVVMWWRPWAKDGPLHAAENHIKIIMTPDGPFYFDAWPDQNSLDAVYNYPIIPRQLTLEQGKYVMGAQANLWTEMVPSEKRADYLTMPRLTALAESVWTNNSNLYNAYRQRLLAQYKRLDNLNINYQLPDLGTLPDKGVFVTDTAFFITSPVDGFTIHYTTDGNLPTAKSGVLSKPVTINKTTVIKVALFTANGRRGDVYTINYDKQSYAIPESISNIKPGLNTTFYNGSFKNTTAIKTQVDSSFQSSDVSFAKDYGGKGFALKFSGYLNIPATGVYTFYLMADDGAILNVANRLVVDNDGNHSPKEKSGQVALAAGLQPIQVNFVEGGGGYTLKLAYSFGKEAAKPVPAEWFVSK